MCPGSRHWGTCAPCVHVGHMPHNGHYVPRVGKTQGTCARCKNGKTCVPGVPGMTMPAHVPTMEKPVPVHVLCAPTMVTCATTDDALSTAVTCTLTTVLLH